MGREDLGSSFLCEGGGWVGGTITVSTSRTLRAPKLDILTNARNSLRSNILLKPVSTPSLRCSKQPFKGNLHSTPYAAQRPTEVGRSELNMSFGKGNLHSTPYLALRLKEVRGIEQILPLGKQNGREN